MMHFNALLLPLLTMLSLVTAVPCDPVSKYTVEWFIGNTCKIPPAATCLFYTRGLSKTARAFSKSGGNDMTTIWELWDKSLYNNKQVTTNPLRCIMQNTDDRKTYFESMSQAVAEMCDVIATVMTKDLENVPTDGIWYNTEIPTLQRFDNQGKVYSIEVCNPDATQLRRYWTRTSSRLHRRTESHSKSMDTIERRDTCGAPNGAEAEFDEGGDYDVGW